MRNAVVALALTAAALPAQALQVSIRDAAGQPLPLAMITLKAERPLRAAGDDNGYPRERSEQRISPEITAFAGAGWPRADRLPGSRAAESACARAGL